MDAAGYRTAQAQGRKFVIGAANVEREMTRHCSAEISTPARTRPVSPAEGYERWAPTYDYDLNPLLAREERYLLPLLARCRPKRFLDLACGTGRWTEMLVSRGVKSGEGCDCSAAMLRVAAGKRAIRKRLAIATCEHLPFRTAVFDLAICSFALGHIEDLEPMVRELARVTSIGADVFVSDLHPEAYERGWRVGFRDSGGAIQIETRARSSEEIVRIFNANGFDCLTCESLWLGNPEKNIFQKAGKSQSFAQACQWPAVLVCHLERGTATGDLVSCEEQAREMRM
jgi:SAM-dependent methyltransferase